MEEGFKVGSTGNRDKSPELNALVKSQKEKAIWGTLTMFSEKN